MILTKKELIQRLLNGEKLTSENCDTNCYCYYDEEYDYPFRYINSFSENIPINTLWNETEWETYKEIPEWWELKENEKAYYIRVGGKIATSRIWDYENYKAIIKQGNVFKTKEEAEKEAKLRAAKYRVKKRIWELNGEFIEFKKDLPNWSFSISRDEKIEAESWYILKFFPNWQYLKTKKLVKQLIDEMAEDLMLIRDE